jgi:hypothetical protein
LADVIGMHAEVTAPVVEMSRPRDEVIAPLDEITALHAEVIPPDECLTATNLHAIATNLRAIATNLRAIPTNLRAIPTNPRAIPTSVEATTMSQWITSLLTSLSGTHANHAGPHAAVIARCAGIPRPSSAGTERRRVEMNCGLATHARRRARRRSHRCRAQRRVVATDRGLRSRGVAIETQQIGPVFRVRHGVIAHHRLVAINASRLRTRARTPSRWRTSSPNAASGQSARPR